MPCACRAGCSTRQCSYATFSPLFAFEAVLLKSFRFLSVCRFRCRKNGHDCTLACQCLECTNRRPKDPARQRDAELGLTSSHILVVVVSSLSSSSVFVSDRRATEFAGGVRAI